MPGYAGKLIDVHDQGEFDEYADGVDVTLDKYGGRMVFGGPIAGVVEGQLDIDSGTRLAVFEFDSLEAARRWYDSPEYQTLIKKRQRISHTRAAFFVDGGEGHH